MQYQFATLGSGSRGNATVVRVGDQCLLVDCGFTLRELEKRLAALALSAADITAVLVTHEHADHIKGVGPLARRHAIPVYMTSGSYISGKCGEIPHFRAVFPDQPFQINDITVTPVAVPHDAREPCQFVFSYCGLKLGILTDLGTITPHVFSQYQGCHGLLVEANHDLTMLANGPYPPSLRARVGSNWGHLNNQQTSAFLQQIDQSALRCLVVGHISEKNNALVKVRELIDPHVVANAEIVYAEQDSATGWLSLL
ncbi:MBL fold metallo-hydrolase [Teredinibacter turnerae]|uniref:MBL fold metallo-hydrolase n=1 Tax=Teredinibacter turnerae TaxID=2426 RepID=UPI00037BC878|nr:MBL fold metallo-hydrolase [Teredinibacter turnerae]